MRAVHGHKGWHIYTYCDICGYPLERRMKAVPGVGAYREMGLFCKEHGLMIPEHVLHDHNAVLGTWEGRWNG